MSDLRVETTARAVVQLEVAVRRHTEAQHVHVAAHDRAVAAEHEVETRYKDLVEARHDLYRLLTPEKKGQR